MGTSQTSKNLAWTSREDSEDQAKGKGATGKRSNHRQARRRGKDRCSSNMQDRERKVNSPHQGPSWTSGEITEHKE
jgi:hypothetical protein